MKQKTINFKAIFFILFIPFFSLYIKCEEPDCSTCTLTENICTNCNIKCKSKLFDSTIGCKYCSFNEEKFYKIEDDNCNPKSQCEDGEKIVYKSNECVSSCSNYFEMGDYCYFSRPENSQCDDINKNCHCLYKYYITTINSKQEYHCLSQTDDCPSDYNNYKFPNNQCLKESDLPGICTYKKIEYRGDTSEIIRCSEGCALNENEVSGNYCVDDCIYLGKNFIILMKKYHIKFNVWIIAHQKI